MKKTIIIVTCVLLAILIFLLLFGRMLFAFCFLPLKDYMCITIPEGRYVSWDELYEYPSDIDDSETAWFPNCLLKWQIKQLAKHMEKTICTLFQENMSSIQHTTATNSLVRLLILMQVLWLREPKTNSNLTRW